LRNIKKISGWKDFKKYGEGIQRTENGKNGVNPDGPKLSDR